jgi:hypothetical protein
MDFHDSDFLRKIPDVSRIPNLKELDLHYCENLVEVHHSVGFLDKLVSLNLHGCFYLRSFPRSLKMRSLKYLNLCDCGRLENFPEIDCQMKCLEDITFCRAGIEELPSSIGHLVGVKTFSLNSYTNLMTLSDNIHKLRHLHEVYNGIVTDRPKRDGRRIGFKNIQVQFFVTPKNDQHPVLENCSKVAEFLKTVLDTTQFMPGVVFIEESTILLVAELRQVPFTKDRSDPDENCSSIVFPKRQLLSFRNWDLSGSNLFRIIDCFSTLTKLSISKSDIVTIPPCIRQLVSLMALYLQDCKQLREILGIPENLHYLMVNRCVSLAIFLKEVRLYPLFNPEALLKVGVLTLGNDALTEPRFWMQRDCPYNLSILNLSGSAIVSLPTWLNTFYGLQILLLSSCNQLEEIPELPRSIREVRADGCTSLERFQFNNIKDLPKLVWIDFSNCHGLRENMGDAQQICLLIEVSLFHIYTCYLYVLSMKSCLIYIYIYICVTETS